MKKNPSVGYMYGDSLADKKEIKKGFPNEEKTICSCMEILFLESDKAKKMENISTFDSNED